MGKKMYENDSLYSKMGLTSEEAEELDGLCLEIAELINSEGENAQREYESLKSEVEQIEIPPGLREDIRSMCADEQKQISKQGTRNKKTGFWIKAAAFLLCFLIPFTAFAPQTEAFRHKVYEIVMEEFDGHVRVEFKKDLELVENVIDEKESAILAEYYDEGEAFLYPAKIVEGYELVEVDVTSIEKNYSFMNDESQYITFKHIMVEGNYYLDTDRGEVKEILINDVEAIFRKGDSNHIVRFYVEGELLSFRVPAENFTEDDLIELAESVELKNF